MSPKDPHEVDRIVGNNIRLVRTSKGMSQEKLAQNLGITFQQVQKYEKGTNRVSASKLVMVCNALDCTLDQLFEGAFEATPPNSDHTVHLSAYAVKVGRMADQLSQTKRTALTTVIKALIDEHEPEPA